MAESTSINVRITAKQLRELKKLTVSLGLNRSNLIRLAISRLIEAETHRPPEGKPAR